MSGLDTGTILALVVMVSGGGVFLRQVAKEKHRRDRHLELRSIEYKKVLEAAARRQARAQGGAASPSDAGAGAPQIAIPVD
jgi:hypothetical protein